MGTSQSHSLKTTPKWSSAKRAMTGIIRDLENPNRYSSFMKRFLSALGDDGVYYGKFNRNEQEFSHKHAFGTAGSAVALNLIDFISVVQNSGLSEAIDAFVVDGVNAPRTTRELINRLCTYSAKDTDANLDMDAAIVAQRKLLAKIFNSCKNLEDVESILTQATEDSIDSWIIDFEIEYIIEYQGTLFQSLIFDKAQDPDVVMGQIRRWLHSKLDSLLIKEMHHIDIFSEQGERYIDSLTSRILEIWKQE